MGKVKPRNEPSNRGNSSKGFERKSGLFVKKIGNQSAKSDNKTDKVDGKQQDSFFVKTRKPAQTNSGDFSVKASNKHVKPSSSSGNGKKTKSEPKKPFDKKQWRLRKYSKKYKLDQWEEKRKKTVLREYYKEIKDDDIKTKFDVKKIYDEDETKEPSKEENENENNLNTDIRIGQEAAKGTKKTAFRKAHLEYQRIQEEKKRKKEELTRKKAERDEALKVYKEKKVKKFKALSKKTRKGQPIMKDRMEMLLAQIQDNLSKE